MYIPQRIVTAMLAFTGSMSSKSKVITSGSILDYAVPTCLDSDGHRRCSRPFTVSASSCYDISWSTEGTLSHTTLEVRDAGSGEIVYYRDTNGEWEAEKNELVYLDFKPKIWKTGNDTVDFEVKECEGKDSKLEMK